MGKKSAQGILTLSGTIMQALEYVYDFTEMGCIEADMANLLSSDLEAAVHMIRQQIWTAQAE